MHYIHLCIINFPDYDLLQNFIEIYIKTAENPGHKLLKLISVQNNYCAIYVNSVVNNRLC